MAMPQPSVAFQDVALAFRCAWRGAEKVLIAAGAGLSAAAGIDYTDTEDFARTFPVLARRGFSGRYQLIGYWDWPEAQHWAYWATHVKSVRFGPRAHLVYRYLRELFAGKDTFVLTSNVDGMFSRNGFEESRIYTPQGDYSGMQCRGPCERAVWPSEPTVDILSASIDPDRFEVMAPSVIPRCPNCGGEVFFNVRVDDSFVDTPYLECRRRFADWLREAGDRPLLVIEIGAGFNTPGVVRWPVEHLVSRVARASLFRINRDDASVPSSLGNRAFSISMDAAVAVESLWRACMPKEE